MPVRSFHFGPQPALDRALAERRRCEDALAESQRNLAAERGRLGDLERILGSLCEQVRGELSRLSDAAGPSCSAASMAARSRFVEALLARERQQRNIVAEQAGQVVLAEQTVRLRTEELNEAIGALQALEAVKARSLAQHRRDRARKEARRTDSTVISQYNRRSTSA